MGTSPFVLSSSWPHFLGILTISVSMLAGLARYILLDLSDPAHCGTLMNRGSWLDSERRNWQPDGCMLYPYKANDGAACLRSKSVIFIGDSVTRNLFFQFANILDISLPTSPTNGKKHSDHFLKTKHGNDVSFFWDPFLNTSRTYEIVESRWSGVKQNDDMQRPALLVLGTGLWYLRYANNSGGLPSWEANMEHIINALAQGSSRPADEIVILPVEQVVPSKLSYERATSMRSSDIDAMNSDLYHRLTPSSKSLSVLSRAPAIPVSLPLVFNQMLDSSLTDDGLHFFEPLVKLQATILLNLRCNGVLSKTFPLNKTCCNVYSWPSMLQFLILGSVVLWGPGLYFLWYQKARHVSRRPDISSSALLFSAAIALVFIADRSGLWLKEQKQYSSWTFAFLCILSIIVGLVNVKTSDKDLGFLNREQTDEWKGWMQLAILIYHYFGASKVSGIYNPIRVLVAAYLFMTGYGHATFYLRKADFSFSRVAQVMVRLNILPLALAYTMNTDYISYYFSPLVSMWFLIIYCTMAPGSRFNDRVVFLLSKILLSASIFTWCMKEPRFLDSLFEFLHQIFGIRWSAREWAFRVNLDLWIVYVGMLAAIAVIKIREHRIYDHQYWPLAVKIAVGTSCITLFWFFGFELYQESKYTYNLWHPYVSFLPILAFVALRNASVRLRSTSSQTFALVGRCSLETFIVQYHLWLAGDTKGVLLVIPGTRWRPANFVITTIMFIYVSDQVARATANITAWICGEVPRTLPLSVTSNNHLSPTIRIGQEAPSRGEAQEIKMPLLLSSRKDGEEGSPPEPDTPIRPRRWVDRLVEEPPIHAAVISSIGIRTKLCIGIILMWLVNLMWTH
ncbi:O-acetyltransferase [Collybia nuda]|uniref:O-acetyltransferase n=1 Tax=Collybia nuda TaxID=64659 RepID=A0A9P6CDT0_9AGAR|nr:O-acetyltransferase [Collybia nuda]